MAYAKAMILGNLTRDPELRASASSGKSVCNFTIAVNRKSGAGENAKEEVSFFDCKAFDKTADNISKFFSKGKPIFVEARPVQESWEDKETKAKRTKIAFIVNEFQFAGGDRSEGGQAQPQRQQQPSHASRPAPAQQENLDEDVPF